MSLANGQVPLERMGREMQLLGCVSSPFSKGLWARELVLIGINAVSASAVIRASQLVWPKTPMGCPVCPFYGHPSSLLSLMVTMAVSTMCYGNLGISAMGSGGHFLVQISVHPQANC